MDFDTFEDIAMTNRKLREQEKRISILEERITELLDIIRNDNSNQSTNKSKV